MIDREDALRLIQSVDPLSGSENVPVQSCVGRILFSPVIAGLTLPPANMSAMDGYAVRRADAVQGNSLKVIGEAAAGHPFRGAVSENECVRVFTGSVIPDGADQVIIQENVDRTGEDIRLVEPISASAHIRKAGIDFSEGQILLKAGATLRPRHLSICAAANHAVLNVRKRPKVAILSNGDELVPPGSQLEEGQIIASNAYTLGALITQWGGEAVDLGVAPDDPVAIRQMIEEAVDVDVFVPVGGASVGDHDHMKAVFAELGFDTMFSKVKVKPGKPTWFSKSGDRLALGLPGNPASALVCAHLFLLPLIAQLLGKTAEASWCEARLTEAISANGGRESFLRGHLSSDDMGRLTVQPAGNQDSSLLSPFILADVLIQRAANVGAAGEGEIVRCLKLG